VVHIEKPKHLIKESICRVLSVCKTSLTSTKLVVSPLAKKGQLDIRLAAHWQESEISAVFKDQGRLGNVESLPLGPTGARSNWLR
jgi:hypothetical protein